MVTLDLRGGDHTTVLRVYGGDDEEDGAPGDAPGLLRACILLPVLT